MKPIVPIRLSSESRINALAEHVFPYLLDPTHLERLIPLEERALVCQMPLGPLEKGSEWAAVLRGGVFAARWAFEITQVDSPRLIEQVATAGPYSKWRHRCRLFDDAKGSVLIRDTIEFELPYGRPGRYFGQGGAKKRMRAWLYYRQHVLGQLLAQDQVAMSRPFCSTAHPTPQPSGIG